MTTTTTTTRLYPKVLAVLAVLTLSMPARARAAAPGSAGPGPTPPPPAIKTAQAEPPPAPSAPPGEEPPPEMTFGHGSPRVEPAPAPAPTPTTPAEAQRRSGRARTMEDVSGATVEELTIRNVRWRYSLNFFGDISLGARKPAEGEGFFGFNLGAQDILIRGELGNNIIAATEVALEPGDAGVSVDVERFHVRYQTSQFFVEAGRTHTGFGYWNNAYHHGRWLQPTIARPRWVAFEDDGGILPVHWVGAGVGARVPVGDATLNVMATMGNGRGHIVDDVRNAHDDQSMKAFHASVELVGIGFPELRMGVAGIYDKIPPFPPLSPTMPETGRMFFPNDSITEFIGAAHVAYVNVPLLFIAEGYLVAHSIGSQSWKTYGGFALVGYAFGRVTPYAEFERIASRGGQDPFFTTVGSQSFDTARGILGIRLDLSDWTALKAEYRQTHDYAGPSTVYEGLVNWSWGF